MRHISQDYHPSSVSDVETLIVTILVVLGAFVWTRVLALFCDIATNSSPGLTAFRQQLDCLNEVSAHSTLRSGHNEMHGIVVSA